MTINGILNRKTLLIILIGTTVIGLVIRILPLIPPETRFIRHIPDDAYYLYQISTNLSDTGALSFDGTNPTATSRPLYILILAGIKSITGTQALPFTAFILGVLADVATAWLLLRILLRLKLSPHAALFGFCLYLLSARTILFTANGMETPWAVLAIAILLNLYPLETANNRTRARLAITRGLALGAMMLLRLDFVFLAVPVYLWELWQSIRNKRLDWLYCGAAVALCILPWAWWSLVEHGCLMPPSGDALTMVLGAKPPPGWAGLVMHLEFLYDGFSDLFPIVMPQYNYWFGTGMGVAFIVVISTLFRSKTASASLRSIAPIAIGAIGLTIYFSVFRMFWREWNLVIGDLLFAMLIALIVDRLLKLKQKRALIAMLVCWLVGANLALLAPYWDGISPGQERMHRAALWLRDNTTEETVVASANGGIIAWYSERAVVDAAGIEDVEANRALIDRQLYEYVKERGVTYLADPPDWHFNFYRKYWGCGMEENLEFVYDPLYDNEERTLFDPIVYKLR